MPWLLEHPCDSWLWDLSKLQTLAAQARTAWALAGCCIFGSLHTNHLFRTTREALGHSTSCDIATLIIRLHNMRRMPLNTHETHDTHTHTTQHTTQHKSPLDDLTTVIHISSGPNVFLDTQQTHFRAPAVQLSGDTCWCVPCTADADCPHVPVPVRPVPCLWCVIAVRCAVSLRAVPSAVRLCRVLCVAFSVSVVLCGCVLCPCRCCAVLLTGAVCRCVTLLIFHQVVV